MIIDQSISTFPVRSGGDRDLCRRVRSPHSVNYVRLMAVCPNEPIAFLGSHTQILTWGQRSYLKSIPATSAVCYLIVWVLITCTETPAQDSGACILAWMRNFGGQNALYTGHEVLCGKIRVLLSLRLKDRHC